MSKVVAVHGVGQQFKGEELLLAEWLPSLNDGMHRAGFPRLAPDDLTCAFYGDLFRKKGTKYTSDPPFDSSDVTDPLEMALLACWLEASRFDPKLPNPPEATKVRAPQVVQQAL